MTSPLSKLRTYNRPTNGLAWVRETERLLAEAYEPPESCTECDAEERLAEERERDGDALEMLVGELGSQDNLATSDPIYMVQEKRRIYGIVEGYGADGSIFTLDGEEVEPDGVEVKEENCEEVFFKDEWVNSQPFLTRKAASEFIERQMHNLKSTRIYVESGYHNLEWRWLREFLPSLQSERARTTAEIERLRARVGELEGKLSTDVAEAFHRGRQREAESVKAERAARLADVVELCEKQTSEDEYVNVFAQAVLDALKTEHAEELANASKFAQDQENTVASLRAERDAAIREREKAKAKAVPGWSQHRDNSDEYVASCLGCGAELTDDEEHAWTDCVKFARESHSVDVEVQAARISELETQLAEVRGMYEGLRMAVDEWIGTGSEADEDDVLRLQEKLDSFPALSPTESKGGDG